MIPVHNLPHRCARMAVTLDMMCLVLLARYTSVVTRRRVSVLCWELHGRSPFYFMVLALFQGLRSTAAIRAHSFEPKAYTFAGHCGSITLTLVVLFYRSYDLEGSVGLIRARTVDGDIVGYCVLVLHIISYICIGRQHVAVWQVGTVTGGVTPTPLWIEEILLPR